MTPRQFKDWFRVFQETINVNPHYTSPLTWQQWELLQDKVNRIDIKESVNDTTLYELQKEIGHVD